MLQGEDIPDGWQHSIRYDPQKPSFGAVFSVHGHKANQAHGMTRHQNPRWQKRFFASATHRAVPIM